MHNSLHLDVAYTQQPPDKPIIAQQNHLPGRQERTGDCQGGIVVQGVAAAATFTQLLLQTKTTTPSASLAS